MAPALADDAELEQLLAAASASLAARRSQADAEAKEKAAAALLQSTEPEDTILLNKVSADAPKRVNTESKPSLMSSLSAVRLDAGVPSGWLVKNRSGKTATASAGASDTSGKDVKLLPGMRSPLCLDTASVAKAEMTKTHAPKTSAPSVPKSSAKDKKKVAQPANAGPGWFGMVSTDMTDEVKRDLQVIRSRAALDPKRHYKREDSKSMPKVFQIGTIVQGATEHYSDRLNRRERKDTIVDELLHDTKTKQFMKRKMKEIFDKRSNFTRKRSGRKVTKKSK